ncbi:hypothetical protein L915_12901 [Phytophthora nicotianae]|nr:hypothetical protein L915_12901 [Phytophthora nicotianae]ETL35018.1 hypothetical protein L916_12810 [Phytophthora nicotianae]
MATSCVLDVRDPKQELTSRALAHTLQYAHWKFL